MYVTYRTERDKTASASRHLPSLCAKPGQEQQQQPQNHRLNQLTTDGACQLDDQFPQFTPLHPIIVTIFE